MTLKCLRWVSASDCRKGSVLQGGDEVGALDQTHDTESAEQYGTNSLNNEPIDPINSLRGSKIPFVPLRNHDHPRQYLRFRDEFLESFMLRGLKGGGCLTKFGRETSPYRSELFLPSYARSIRKRSRLHWRYPYLHSPRNPHRRHRRNHLEASKRWGGPHLPCRLQVKCRKINLDRAKSIRCISALTHYDGTLFPFSASIHHGRQHERGENDRIRWSRKDFEVSTLGLLDVVTCHRCGL